MPRLRFAVVLFLITVMASASGPFRSVESFGPKVPLGRGTPNPYSVDRWTQVPLSDAEAIAFVARYDAFAASRMLHRVGESHVGTTPWFTDETTPNWGGYTADTGGAFLHRTNGVKSYFRASHASSGGPTGSWVGIGGWYDPPSNLLQTGLDMTTSPMQAWYELIPSSDPMPHYVLVYANEGDTMWGFIHWDASTNTWLVQIQNATSGQYYSARFTYQPDIRTSEWITEVKFNTGNVPSFTAVHYYNGYWYDENDLIQVIASGESTTVWREILVVPYPYTGCVYPNALYGSGETFDNRSTCVP